MFQTHPLDLYEIRSRIASSLGGKDLASCARVSQDWNDSFTPPLYNSVILSEDGLSMESVKRNKHLIKCLKIYKSNSYNRVISSFLANSCLEILDLQGNWIGSSVTQALSAVLKTNSTLTTLNLDFNSIGDIGAQALAQALMTNTTLTTLDLSYNSIGSNGALALSEALKINSTLTTLDLECNSIGSNGAQALSEALSTQDQLDSDHFGLAQALSEALKINSTLADLSLYGNMIGDNGVQALAQALKINSTVSIEKM
ncbi:hypothetical protein BGZ97_008322, partial [Linnemannia gamsii]